MSIKNLKLNKKKLLLLGITSITLLTGCTAKDQEQLTVTLQNIINNPSKCQHLTIIFQNETITFSECEEYVIKTTKYENELEYDIYQDHQLVVSGTTSFYNDYDVYHDRLDEEKILIKNNP